MSEQPAATVYVVQDSPGRSFVDAMRYGTVKGPLLPATDNLFLSTQPVIRKLRRELRNFNDNDYLLLIGDPNIIGVACAVAASINRGRFKTLKWDREQRRYYPAECDVLDRTAKEEV